jgi:4-hydroxy-3-methylbut-2-enyl diphosphate reductase
MRVRVATSFGFCKGVRQAFALAERSFELGSPVYLLGELVHNHDAMETFRARGARIVENPEEIPSGAVVITRSHGIPKDVREELLKKNATIVDTTCSKVKRVQVLARQLEEEGYHLVVFGKASHPEVQALLSVLKKQAQVVAAPEEWQRVFAADHQGPFAVLAQTTFPSILLRQFENWIREQNLSGVRIMYTLCDETEKRQRELEQNLEQNPEDVVIVVGGKHSANTCSLFVLARRRGVPVFWVENATELRSLSLPKKASFFVTSGTSTPDWVVQEIVAYLRSL